MNDKARDAKIAAYLEAKQLYNPVSIVRLVQQNEPDMEPLTVPRLRIRLTRLARQHRFPPKDGELRTGPLPVPAWKGERWINALNRATPETLAEILEKTTHQVIEKRLLAYPTKKECAASLGLSHYQLNHLIDKYCIKEPPRPKPLINLTRSIAILEALEKAASQTISLCDLCGDELTKSILQYTSTKLIKAGILSHSLGRKNRRRLWQAKAWRDAAVHIFILQCCTDLDSYWSPDRFADFAPHGRALVENAIKCWLHDYAANLEDNNGWKGLDLFALLLQQGAK